MKASIRMKSVAVAVLAAMAMSVAVPSASAQSEVKANKLLKAQKISGKTVLKSNDSRLPQTLAYFDHEVDMNNLPQEVRSFLRSYEEAVRRIEQGASQNEVLLIGTATTNDSVGPILGDIEFDQGTPYNNKCPYLNGARAVTGCVATAMAQIMTYYRYPAKGTGTATYTGSSGQTTYNYNDHPFDWNNILHQYKGNYTTEQGNAVAELMLACGASVNMNYNYDGSGANSEKVLPALRDIFGFDPAIEYSAPDPVGDPIQNAVWTEAFKMEFDAKRPVYYSGGTQADGHAFVLDGYKVVNNITYFHVNWGWSGGFNGWFLLTALCPHPGEAGYSYRNQCVYQIFPLGAGIDNTKESGALKVDMDAPVYTILGSKIPASSMQRGMIYIQNGRKFVW